MNKFFFFFFSFLQLITSTLFAQQTKQRFKVIDADSLRGIPFATIQVLNKSIVQITDYSGIAQVDIAVSDTVLIKALGYFPIKLVISSLQMPPVYRVLMLPQSIDIQEVTIKGIRSKEELKMAILKMRVEEKQKDLPGLKTYHGPLKRPPAGPMSPITMIYETEWAKKKRAKKWSKSLIMPQIK